MTPTEKAIRDFCGHHADWWPSTTQVQEMLALAQPCPTCEALARTVMLDQTSHDAQRKPLTDEMVVAAARVLNERQANACNVDKDDQWAIYCDDFKADARAMLKAAHGIKE